MCAAIILAPILMSLQGISVHTYDSARYLICSLPLLLIVMAAGIDGLARVVWQRGPAIVAWGMTALTVVCWTPYVRAQFLVEKQWPYAQVARFLHVHMRKNDVIVTGWGLRSHSRSSSTTLKIAYRATVESANCAFSLRSETGTKKSKRKGRALAKSSPLS
jgi:hypothetical protein